MITANTIITKEMIEDLKTGDIIPNVFNDQRKITRITFRGISPIDGKG